MERFGAGEKRKHVAFVAHADEDDVETGKLAGGEIELNDVSSCSYSCAAFSASGFSVLMRWTCSGLSESFGEHGLVGHAELLSLSVGPDVALVTEEDVCFSQGMTEK